MRIFTLLLLICTLYAADAQDETADVQFAMNDIDNELAKQYTRENFDDLISLVDYLPMRVTQSLEDADHWLAERDRIIEMYLKWYQKMFAAGFKLNDNSKILSNKNPIPDETEEQRKLRLEIHNRNVQKNNSIAAFLRAEQRLQHFMKNTFKGKKRKQFKNALLAFEGPYVHTVEKINSEVLASEFGFVVYEKKVKNN